MTYTPLYRDVYEFHARHMKQQDWAVIMAEMKELEAKHGHTQFASDMLVAVVAELERCMK